MTAIGLCSSPSEPQLLHSANRGCGSRNHQHETVRCLHLVSTSLPSVLDFDLISLMLADCVSAWTCNSRLTRADAGWRLPLAL